MLFRSQPAPDPPGMLSPRLRRRAARTRRILGRLRRDLVDFLPTAPLLVAEPSIAERIDTTPEDHLAADALVAITALLDALADLEHSDLVAPCCTGSSNDPHF